MKVIFKYKRVWLFTFASVGLVVYEWEKKDR